MNPNKGWRAEDCYCCAGIQWGGDYPRECPDCKGGGSVWIHDRSGVIAEWPGGPFLGRKSKKAT